VNLETVEDAIVAKLAEITNVHVQSWPDNPNDFNHIHPSASLLVRYNGSSYNEPEPNNQKFLTQTRTAQWIVTVIQRSLKLKDGHQGIYALLESVRAKLSGYTPASLSDASIMWPTGDRFVSEQAGTWLYEMTFSHTYPETEA
jgi:hypothetical protein